MIKFVAKMTEGSMYGFGLTETNLNRMEFNQEPIFFDFGYTDHPELFGLILYMGECKEPEDIAANPEALEQRLVPFLNVEHGVTLDTLLILPIAESVMQEFRSTPFWGFSAQIEITHPADQQLVFAGRDEKDIEQYLQKTGLVSPRTKRTSKGFGKY
jgi:hypothetical protein